jgi:hypothetical protein
MCHSKRTRDRGRERQRDIERDIYIYIYILKLTLYLVSPHALLPPHTLLHPILFVAATNATPPHDAPKRDKTKIADEATAKLS